MLVTQDINSNEVSKKYKILTKKNIKDSQI